MAAARINEIMKEETVQAPYRAYFVKTAQFLETMIKVREDLESGAADSFSLEQLQERNQLMYADILPANYETSYANPTYAVKELGEGCGQMLSLLYAELRGIIGDIFDGFDEGVVVELELFLQIYGMFESASAEANNPGAAGEDAAPAVEQLREALYWYVSDYADVFVAERVRRGVDPEPGLALEVLKNSDFTDLRYLYKYGEYVTENELKTAQYLNGLDEEKIGAMAFTFSEGYRIGFVNAGKDLSKKLTANVRYHLGFERIIAQAVKNLEDLGLKTVIFRYAVHLINKRGTSRIGYEGANPNPQFDYDHREDMALGLDKAIIDRALAVMHSAYEDVKELAKGHAGPAVQECFGEEPFVPVNKPECLQLSEKQRELSVKMMSEMGQLTTRYIPGDERSFTIIAFPVPDIGEDFEAIFDETVKVNTLDNKKWIRIQQALIDALDKGTAAHILGMNGNRTDLTVALQELKDPAKETIFENCVADVNIPVGEVFTSPKLTGTNGVLHVSSVFLNGLQYKDLELNFENGMIAEYNCANFPAEKDNKEYIEANLLYHHKSLPMGEFAIGTNTTAYVMMKKFDIASKMPILIAEKTGPHFAVGDTCYSWSEDNAVYNPDGKEIIARDNEVSLLRTEDPGKAYFNCHTDITIPYEELGLIEVCCADGTKIPLIQQGRFVLPGTEELNEVLD